MKNNRTTRRRLLQGAGAAGLFSAIRSAFPGGAFAATDTPETNTATLGFIALTDSSPVIIAKEKGFFAKYGLTDIKLAKQASWATTRDNIELGAKGGGIDGAHILTPLPYLISTGKVTKSGKVPMHILARLNVNGQAISVSKTYKDMGVGLDSSKMKAVFAKMRQAGNDPKVAMTFPGGTHDLWIRYWLAAGGIDPDKDVTTMAVLEAQRWCDTPANRAELCDIVSRREYFKVPVEDILPRTSGTIDYGTGKKVDNFPYLMKFWKDFASYPFQSHETWFLTEDIRWGQLPANTDVPGLVKAVNREDIWRDAAKAIGVSDAEIPKSTSRGVEKFFDGKLFDPANPKAYLDSLKIKRV